VIRPLPHIDAAAEGNGARARPARLRRRQHAHLGFDRSVRGPEFRADLRRTEPARRDPLVHPSTTASARRSSTTTIHAPVGTSLEDASFVLHMIAKHIRTAIPTSGSSLPASRRAESPCCSTGSTRRGRAAPPPEILAEAPSVTPEILLRHGVLRLEGGVLLRLGGIREDHPSPAATTRCCRISRATPRPSAYTSASGLPKSVDRQGAAPQRAETGSGLPIDPWVLVSTLKP